MPVWFEALRLTLVAVFGGAGNGAISGSGVVAGTGLDWRHGSIGYGLAACHYVYECDVGGETRQYRHKIVDWEAGALYWNCCRSHGAGWEVPFRAQLEQTLPNRDLQFLVGIIHRFPDQWLIVSLIYPPKIALAAPAQNITNEDFLRYTGTEDRVRDFRAGERTFTFGIQAKF